MERIECFKINGAILYLDMILVEYNNIPLFFICKDEEEYYISLCYDLENLNYYIVNSNLKKINMLLHQKISIYDVMTSCDEFYDVESGETMDEDIVIKKNIEKLDDSFLPEKGEVYRVISQEVKDYSDKIENEYYSMNTYETINTNSLQLRTIDEYESIKKLISNNYLYMTNIKISYDLKMFEQLNTLFSNKEFIKYISDKTILAKTLVDEKYKNSVSVTSDSCLDCSVVTMVA